MELTKNKRYRYIASALLILFAGMWIWNGIIYHCWNIRGILGNLASGFLFAKWDWFERGVYLFFYVFLLAIGAGLMTVSLLFKKDRIFLAGCVLQCAGYCAYVILNWDMVSYCYGQAEYASLIRCAVDYALPVILSILLIVAAKKKENAKKLCWGISIAWIIWNSNFKIVPLLRYRAGRCMWQNYVSPVTMIVWAAAVIMIGYVFSSDPSKKSKTAALKETTVSGKIQKIEKLKALRDCGAITQEDFEAKKKEILEGTL